MKKLLTAALLLAPLPALAQNAYPTIDILSATTTILGEKLEYPTTGPARVTASIVTIAPQAETAFHKHGAPLFAYVLEGELVVDYGSAGKRSYRPGEAFMEAQAFSHRGTNPGNTPVRLLAVYLGADGTSNVVLEKK